MTRRGPFEPQPLLAVAVSGGRDSMALAVLADAWARRRRGRAIALVVDHGLRPGSGREAGLVRRRLAALGLECHVLRWAGPKPASAIQATARAARYALLENWCARRAILHLLTAHQADDQAETILMRRRRGSGPDGLAGIAAVVEREHVRVLRPLLAVPRAALGRFLERRGIAWVDDPSNENPRFERSRIRAERAAGAPGTAEAIDWRPASRARAAREAACARLLARHAAVFPQGYGWIDRATLRDGDPDLAELALARLLGCIGGGAYAPRGAALAALLAALRQPGPFRGRTLAGCRLLARQDRILVLREPQRAGERDRGQPDGRFRLAEGAGAGGRTWRIAPLGDDGWRTLLRRFPQAHDSPVPPPARPALPALWDRRGLLAVPHLGYGRAPRKADSLTNIQMTFRPLRPLCSTEFPVA